MCPRWQDTSLIPAISHIHRSRTRISKMLPTRSHSLLSLLLVVMDTKPLLPARLLSKCNTWHTFCKTSTFSIHFYSFGCTEPNSTMKLSPEGIKSLNRFTSVCWHTVYYFICTLFWQTKYSSWCTLQVEEETNRTSHGGSSLPVSCQITRCCSSQKKVTFAFLSHSCSSLLLQLGHLVINSY